MNVEPCTVCGGTDLNLVDGFYYCVECGTQDMNVRETVLEERALADGTFTIRRHTKITKLVDDVQELCGEWHKWHAFNFMLSGIADQLIAAGAKPTFKMKLLWLWTKYIKMFQNKNELGLTKNGEETNQVSDDSSDDENINDSNVSKSKKRPKYRTLKMTTDLSIIKKGVLCGLVYAALNLDHSEILLSDLMRFIREARLDFNDCTRYLPKEVKVRLIPQFDAFSKSKVTPRSMQIISLSVFKCLNVLPVLPDLRLIVDRYIKELCLPNDFKNLVLSLMNLVPCDNFLDIDRSILKSLLRLPPYEYSVMAYILVAFKMCFGLDDNYEVKLSDTIEEINDKNCYLKAYKLGGYCEPTDRLFSFREWCSFIQLRKRILCKHYLYMAEQYSLDVDDYVYMEQCPGRKKAREPLLSDEITMNILDKIPQINKVEVIPKSEFKPTLTPFSTYTDLVLQYFKDPDLRLLFSEDFTGYSLKYACQDLKLCSEEDVRNIILGVDESKKVINKRIYGLLEEKTHDSKMVYVRNCDNKNWLKTNRPCVEHIKKVRSSNSDRDSDHGYDSNADNAHSNTEFEISSSKDEVSSAHNSVINDNVTVEVERKLQIIEEEDSDKNIFDDDFENLIFVDKNELLDVSEIKEEEPDLEENNNQHQNIDAFHDNLILDSDDNKDNISLNTLDRFFNPDTFDRSKTIKELVLATCKKYKITIPKEYNTKEPTKRKSKFVNDMAGESGAKRPRLEDGRPKRTIAKRGEANEQIHRLLADYYSNLQKDVMFQISEHVKTVVNVANRTLEVDDTIENDAVEEIGRNDVNITDETDSGLIGTVNNAETINEIVDEPNHNDTNENVASEQSSLQFIEKDGDENDNEEQHSQAKGDPKFDEKEYDIKQLYVKVDGDQETDLDDTFEDAELNAILDKKIEEISKGEVFSNDPNIENKDSESLYSESDDDMPLSVLKEEINEMQQRQSRRERLQPLVLKQENITDFKYWTRFYTSEKMRKLYELNEPFNLELQENFPTSFHFVIRECAGIVDCSPYHLYKSMIALEQRILSHNT